MSDENKATLAEPIPMILFCWHCFHQHFDEGEWKTRPHKTHLCETCGQTFRPASVPTIGVKAV